jgi:hypothetical protein
VPWASYLFERLDSHEGYAAGRAVAGRVRTLPGTQDRIEESMKRLRSLYVRGLMPADEFEREQAHFEGMRAELTAQLHRSLQLSSSTAYLPSGNRANRKSGASCCCRSSTACTSATAGSTTMWPELTGAMKSWILSRLQRAASRRLKCWHQSPSPADPILLPSAEREVCDFRR